MSRMKRAVGYCIVNGCDDKSKGVFLLNHGDSFVCPRCRKSGIVVPESGHVIDRGPVFKEVRVEFDYNADDRKYHGLAIVKDNAVEPPASIYTLRSPLIRTEKRALKVAEGTLATLMRPTPVRDGEIPRATEYVLSFDCNANTFKDNLSKLSDELSQGWLSEDSSLSAGEPMKKEEQ